MLITVSANLRLERDPTRLPLGQGNFGTVHVYRDLQLNADLAVKSIPMTDFSGRSEYYVEAARVYAVRHANVVEVLYACEDADTVYLAMPIYERGSLETFIEQRRLTVREVATLGIGMLSGLNHIHSTGMVHADVKPGNVLISRSGQAAVSDFGLARHIDLASGTATGGKVYGPHLPPERLLSPAITVRFDVYQAGVTLYRMLYGAEHFQRRLSMVPASGLHAKITDGTLFDHPKKPHIPEALRRAVKKAMSPNPDDRHGTCLDLANDLAKIDTTLDWRLSETAGTMEWKNEGDTREPRVRLNTDAHGKWAVESTKRRGRGRQRVPRHCAQSLTETQALAAVRTALVDMEKNAKGGR